MAHASHACAGTAVSAVATLTVYCVNLESSIRGAASPEDLVGAAPVEQAASCLGEEALEDHLVGVLGGAAAILGCAHRPRRHGAGSEPPP